MLIKNTFIDQITIGEDKTIFVRQATIVLDNGVPISKSYHRTTLVPGSDLTGQDQSVVDIANLVWTPEVVSAYIAKTTIQPAQILDNPNESSTINIEDSNEEPIT